MADAQTIGALSITALAVVGFNVPEVPLNILLIVAAIVGSVQAASLRLRNREFKGIWSFCWTFIAGVTAGLWVGDGIASILGLEGSTAEILPVYLVSLAGAKLIVAVINLDVKAWVTRALEKRFGK